MKYRVQLSLVNIRQVDIDMPDEWEFDYNDLELAAASKAQSEFGSYDEIELLSQERMQ